MNTKPTDLPADPLFDRHDFAYLLRRYRILLLAIPPLACLLVVGVFLCVTPLYESYATLLVNPDFNRAIQLENRPDNAQDLPPLTALKSMEVAVIADSVILRVIDKLKLREEKDFLPPSLAAKPRLLDSEILAFLKNNRIRAALIEETRLIEIAVRDRHPERARKIASQLATELESFLQDQKMLEITQSRQLLKEKAEKARQSALAADEKLRQFRLEHPRIVVEQDHDLFAQRLASMGAELNQVKRELAQFEGREKTLRDLDPAKSPMDVIGVADYKIFQHVSNLQSAYAASVANREAVAQTHTPNHPLYKAALAREESNRAELAKLAKDIKSAVSANLTFLREREKIIEQDLQEARQQFDEVKALSSQFRGIQQQSEREWATHQALQLKLTETDVTGVTGYQAATLISPPLLPYEPVFPRVLRFGFVGGFAGVFISAALLAFLVLRGVPLSHSSQIEAMVPGCAIIDETSMTDQGASSGIARLLVPNHAVIHVLSLDAGASLPRVAEELSRAAAQAGRACLCLKIVPSQPGDARIQPAGAGNLFSLTLSASQAKDFVHFPRYLNELKLRFKHIILDASECADEGLEAYLARLANHSLAVAQYGRTRKKTLARRAGDLIQPFSGDSLSCLFAKPS